MAMEALAVDVIFVTGALMGYGVSEVDARLSATKALQRKKRLMIVRGEDYGAGTLVTDDLVSEAFTVAKQIEAMRDSASSSGDGDDMPEGDMPGLVEGGSDVSKPSRIEIDAGVAQIMEFSGTEESKATVEAFYKGNKYDVMATVNAMLKFVERGKGAAEAAMAEFNSPEYDDVNSIPVVPLAPPSLESATDKLFAACDWERQAAGGDMSERVCGMLFQPPFDDEDTKRSSLALCRPYATCPAGGGTLLHLLCDLPAAFPDSQAMQYHQMVDILLGMRVPADPAAAPVLVVDAPRPFDGHTPLARAVAQGHLSAVRSLLDAGADPNRPIPRVLGSERALSPLLLALGYDGPDADVNERAANIANLLVEKGADVNGIIPAKDEDGFADAVEEGGSVPIPPGALTSVWQAVSHSKWSCIAELLKRGADPNAKHQGVPPLLLAVQKSAATSLERLAEHPACDLGGRGDVPGGATATTALIEAVRAYKRPRGSQTVKFLLEAQGGSVDVNAVNNSGESAASVALATLSAPSDAMAKLLLLVSLLDRPKGAAPANLKGVELGETLVEVVRFREKAVPWLQKIVLTGGADPNAPEGRPLSKAIASSHSSSVDMVKILLAAGADPNLCPRGGDNPADSRCAPLILAVKGVIEELDKRAEKLAKARIVERKVRSGGGFRGARGAMDPSPTPEEEACMAVAEAKLNLIAACKDLDKKAKDDAAPFGTAADLLLARHAPALERLEATGPGSFWATTDASGGGGADEYGLDTISDQQAAMRAAREEARLVALVEAGPKKRADFLARVAAVEQTLEDIGKRRKVWLQLHQALQAFEASRAAPPSLAGKDWADLRHELSFGGLDGADGDASAATDGEVPDEGLTTMTDLMAATGKETVPRRKAVRGASGGVGPKKAKMLRQASMRKASRKALRPPSPPRSIGAFLGKLGLDRYQPLLAAEEVTLDLLSMFNAKDYIELKIPIDDAERMCEGIDDLNKVVEARAAYEEQNIGASSDKSGSSDEEGSSGSGGDADETGGSRDAERPGERADGAGVAAAEAAEAAARAAAAQADAADDSSDGEYERPEDFVLSTVPGNIELTRYAYQWIQRADPASVAMALKKLHLLAEGPAAWKRSRQLSKVLEGQVYTPTKFPVREAKLDRGMRILWQERGAVYHNDGGGAPRGAIIIWYIVKHDFISQKLKDIDRCFMRMNGDRAPLLASPPTGPLASGGDSAADGSGGAGSSGSKANAALDAAFKGGASGQAGRHSSIPEVLLDPRGNTPLMVYDVMVHELPQLEGKWRPPMRLTAKEERIVNKEGLVTIVGRSGTGKTVCVAMRMDRDAKRAAAGNAQQRNFRQVFVARSRALCSQVKRMVESGGHQAAATGRREAEAKKQRDMADAAALAMGGSLSLSAASAAARAAEVEDDEEERVRPAQFVTIDNFVQIVEDHVRWGSSGCPKWDVGQSVRWHEFEKLFWPSLDKQAQKGFGSAATGASRKAAAKHKAKAEKGSGGAADGDEDADDKPTDPLVPLTVWTQIRSFIKGSVEAAWGFQRAPLPPPYLGVDPIEKARHDEEVDRLEASTFEARAPGTPMGRAEYMAMDRSRCPLLPAQRKAAYEYYVLYQQWLSDTKRWDDTDRILFLIGKLKGGERSRMDTSIWRDNRVPFDRIYADEVQDATQAEVTLLSLSCNDHVDGLFLAGDNAQAITHGVSFRFEELRLIMKLASGKGGSEKAADGQALIRSQKLVHNYRSHSGILEFAASFLTSLDACFPRSYSAMAADHGLSRGPRPGLWTCPHGLDSVKRALKVDERLIVLTRDENAKALEKLIGEDADLARSVNILGICEAKGLEFNDVLLVDFFGSAPKHLQEAWVKFLNLKVLDEDPLATKEVALAPGETAFVKKASKGLTERVAGRVPLDLEVDLKILYTAVTRSRNRLVLCETAKSTPWAKFAQAYERYGLVTAHALPEVIEEGSTAEHMMPDELVKLGLDFVERVDPSSGDSAQNLKDCVNAIKFFRRAGEGARGMLERAETVARQTDADVWNKVKRAPRDQWEDREAMAAAAAADLLKVGLVGDAVDLCRLANSGDAAVVGPLVDRLQRLEGKWRAAGESKRPAPRTVGGGGAVDDDDDFL